MFKHWAMPVEKRRWALVTLLMHGANRHLGWRLPRPWAHLTHRAWERAVGVG